MISKAWKEGDVAQFPDGSQAVVFEVERSPWGDRLHMIAVSEDYFWSLKKDTLLKRNVVKLHG